MTSDEAVAAEAETNDDWAYLRFDGLTNIAWDDEVVLQLDQWEQGDLVSGAPLFWAGPKGQDLVLGTAGGADAWQVIDEGPVAEGWSVVTSQTCDIAGTGPGAHQPFVDVSPVLRLPASVSEDKILAIKGFEMNHLVALTDPPSAGTWVVDLRLSVPASKGLLLECVPLTPWKTEKDRLHFAEAVAQRKRRPALHEVLSESLVDALRGYLTQTHKTAPEWWASVEQVRLLIDGDRLDPLGVSLIVLQRMPLEDDQKALWRGWKKQASKLLRPYGIKFEPILFSTLDRLPARLYRDSVPLRIPELGRPPTW